MFYVLLFVLAVLGVGIYLLFFMQHVPGAKEERLGVLEPLPEDVGVWRDDDASPEGQSARHDGLRREVRTYFDEHRNRLLRQARYRNESTGEIVRTEPDQVVKRRRVRS